MHKRIRELVRQAGLDDADFPIENWDNVPLAKFAELIVQECAKVAYECGPAVVWGSERQFNPVTYTGNQILIHFGVEE